MALDKDKKEKIDQIMLDRILNTRYVKSMCKSVPRLAYLDWDYEEIYDNCILAYYETALREAEKTPIEEINEDNHPLFVGIYNYSKYRVQSLLLKHRNRSHGQPYVTEKILSYDGFEETELDSVLIDKKDVEYYKSFIHNWFLSNSFNVCSRSTKSEEYLDYIEHPCPRDEVDEDGNVIKKGAINYTTNMRKLFLTEFNKQFSNKIGVRLTWRKQKFTPEEQEQWKEQYSLIIDTAEILSDIDTIDAILDSDHIGAEFNKYKDTPLLFNMFYDNISAASRISINKKHYSNDSISELKSNLENQKNKLINKLHKKEVELNDINSKSTFNK